MFRKPKAKSREKEPRITPGELPLWLLGLLLASLHPFGRLAVYRAIGWTCVAVGRSRVIVERGRRCVAIAIRRVAGIGIHIIGALRACGTRRKRQRGCTNATGSISGGEYILPTIDAGVVETGVVETSQALPLPSNCSDGGANAGSHGQDLYACYFGPSGVASGVRMVASSPRPQIQAAASSQARAQRRDRTASVARA